MQQLQLQFEGFASSWQPIDAGTAKQCNEKREPSALLVRIVRTAGAKYANCRCALSGLTVSAQQRISPWRAAWQRWAATRSETFTALCATEQGEVFNRGDVVKAHLALAVIMVLVAVGGAL